MAPLRTHCLSFVFYLTLFKTPSLQHLHHLRQPIYLTNWGTTHAMYHTWPKLRSKTGFHLRGLRCHLHCPGRSGRHCKGGRCHPSFGCMGRWPRHQEGCLGLVFAGSVAWTEKKTETEPNTTEKDRTNGCGCTNSEVFQLPVTRFYVIWKDHWKPVHTGCNQSSTYI